MTLLIEALQFKGGGFVVVIMRILSCRMVSIM